MVAATVVPELGKAMRLIAEQAGHMLGRGLTGDAPDEFLLVIHLAGMFLLAVTLWLWARDDPLTGRFMKTAAVSMLPLAPAGLPIAGLLFWMARRPDLRHASDHMPQIAGHRRLLFITLWVAATFVGAIAALGAFFLFGWLTLLWLPAMVASALPAAAMLWWMMAPRQRADEMVEAAMPQLPEMVVDQQYP